MVGRILFSYYTNQYSRSRLLSASNPENGTVNYVYNNDATLQAKTDAKNIKTEYSYDSYKRPTQMRKLLWNGSAHVEDRCQRVEYTYDGGGGANYGKLTKMRWSWDANNQPCALPGSNGTAGFEENYTYTAAGLVLSKTLSVSRNGATNTWNLASAYTYNNEGAMLTMTYPAHRESHSGTITEDRSMVVTNTLGSLGRLESFTATAAGGVAAQTIASGAQYNHFSALTSLNVLGSTETRTYNVLGQLTRITGLGIDLEYTFSATQNDGKITAQKNWVSGEEVAYQYDSLERLISAVTTGPQWGLSFGYDGFGNRLSQTVTKGTAPSNSVLVDGTTNRISSAGFVYDLNGNMTNMPTNTATLTYDASNRMTQYSGTNISEAYAYAPDNKRIWRSNTMRGCEVPNTPGQSQPTPTQGDAIIFYSAHGLKLGVYCLKEAFGVRFQIASEQNLYFGGRFVARVGLLRNVVSIGTDRLHSTQSQGGHFPYGEFKSGGATAQDKEEFGTYTRDRSGLDYADQRWYSPGLGRFLTSDPFEPSAHLIDPGSWNRFAYTRGEPQNRIDPSGLLDQVPIDSGVTFSVTGYSIAPAVLPVPTTLTMGSSWGEQTLMADPSYDYWATQQHLVYMSNIAPMLAKFNLAKAEDCSLAQWISTPGECGGANSGVAAGMTVFTRSFRALGISMGIAVNMTGRLGESVGSKILNLPKNTLSITKFGLSRIPDFINVSRTIAYEFKTVGEYRLTQQTIDTAKLVKSEGMAYHLYLWDGAKVSQTTLDKLAELEIVVVRWSINDIFN